MEHTKLKHLDKEEFLTDWEKSQRRNQHRNPQFFIQLNEIDPWEIKRQEENIIKKNIPALKDYRYPLKYNNREMNQIIQNKKWDSMKNNFGKF